MRGEPVIVRGRLLVLGFLLCLALVSAPAAAAGPFVSIQVSAASGAAPLNVMFTAVGDPAAFSWDFGDGATARSSVSAAA